MENLHKTERAGTINPSELNAIKTTLFPANHEISDSQIADAAQAFKEIRTISPSQIAEAKQAVNEILNQLN